jgi:hypothetical protein
MLNMHRDHPAKGQGIDAGMAHDGPLPEAETAAVTAVAA